MIPRSTEIGFEKIWSCEVFVSLFISRMNNSGQMYFHRNISIFNLLRMKSENKKYFKNLSKLIVIRYLFLKTREEFGQ